MKVDGKAIAKDILDDLAERVAKLKEKGITPHLAIILVGHDPASEAYVRQKKLKGEKIGARVTVLRYESRVSNEELLAAIQRYNNDQSVHGIIVQRPLPPHINSDSLDRAVDPQKDLDAFHPNSSYEIPIATAVFSILEYIFTAKSKLNKKSIRFNAWLKQQKIIVIGKGQTGGGPIMSMLRREGIKPLIIDSKTANSEQITKEADIIVSAVGKPNVIKPKMVRKGVILISVGLHKGPNGKLCGEYEEEEIKNIASFYTPTPGGVGPVNVATLLANLISAAEHFPH